MKEEQLKAIEQRANAATRGPWFLSEHDGSVMSKAGCSVAETEQSDEDARFIAHAREDIPALIAAMREREMVIKTLSHAMMKAHEEIAAGKLTTASNRLALALSLVVPS